MDAEDGLDRLKGILRRIGPAAVAYSGGADSTLLLKVAFDELGPSSIMAVIVTGDLTSRAETEQAIVTARKIGVEPTTVDVDMLSMPGFRRNPLDRCYLCKKAIFTAIINEASIHKFGAVVDGSHAGDLDADRPGMKALRELGVRSPLTEAGLDKEDVRRLSAMLSLPTAHKPASPCLATRIPFGQEITTGKLRQIERAEQAVRELGIEVVRVRHHGDLARIEVERACLPTVRTNLDRLVPQLNELGFSKVEVDPRGYRSGSLGEDHKK